MKSHGYVTQDWLIEHLERTLELTGATVDYGNSLGCVRVTWPDNTFEKGIVFLDAQPIRRGHAFQIMVGCYLKKDANGVVVGDWGYTTPIGGRPPPDWRRPSCDPVVIHFEDLGEWTTLDAVVKLLGRLLGDEKLPHVQDIRDAIQKRSQLSRMSPAEIIEATKQPAPIEPKKQPAKAKVKR